MQTNRVVSSYFRLGRATCQGSGLSPALYCLTLKPLAEAIRRDSSFPGIKLGESVQNLALYADDKLCFVTDSVTSIPALLDIINNFPKLSGYRVTWNKSEALPLAAYCPPKMF